MIATPLPLAPLPISTELVIGGESGVNAGFTDFLIDGTTGGGAFDDTDFTAGVRSAGGYIYREIGTVSFTGVTIAGDNFWRDNGQSQRNALTVALYSLPAADTFAFAESGNDIATAPGVNVVGSNSAAAPAARDTVEAFSFDYDVSSLAAGDRLFVRIASDGGGLGYVDNLTFTPIPEPSSVALIGLAFSALALRRRR